VLELCRSMPSNMQISDKVYLPTLPLFRFSMSCSVTCIVSRLECSGSAPIKPSRLANKLKISQQEIWVATRPKGNQTVRSCRKLEVQRLCGPSSAIHAQAQQQSQSLATASDGRAIVTQPSMMTHSLVRRHGTDHGMERTGNPKRCVPLMSYTHHAGQLTKLLHNKSPTLLPVQADPSRIESGVQSAMDDTNFLTLRLQACNSIPC